MINSNEDLARESANQIDYAEQRHKDIRALAQEYKDDPEFFRGILQDRVTHEVLYDAIIDLPDLSFLLKAITTSQDPACAIINDALSDYAIHMARGNVDK